MSIVSDPPVPRTRFWWLPYAYLLRVQLICAAILVGGPFVAVRSPIANGIFDLDYGDPLISGAAMTLVSLAAFLTAWTLLASSVTTMLSAPARFKVVPVGWVRFPIQWPEREAFGVLALFPIGSALTHSWQASGVDRRYLLGGALIGLAVAVGVLLAANAVARGVYRGLYGHARTARRLDVRVCRWLIMLADRPNVREGFINLETNRLEAWHLLAWVVFLATCAFYGGIGLYKAFHLGVVSTVSTLAYALLLLMLLCWFFAGLAFFFDRYRVPVLAIVVGTFTVIGFIPLPGNDHVYATLPRGEGSSPLPDDVLKAAPRTPILIAATGGGIQAAAWAARVLTGIDAAMRPDFGDAFVRSIRLTSTVSGGGVGVMYFSARYRPTPNRTFAFAHDEGELVVKEASASSLDDVAWGVAYPDLIGLLVPQVRARLGDRGQALEAAWTRAPNVNARLADWREQVWSALRPANIFNATIVDTGERLAIGTSRIGWHPQWGLKNHEDLYPDRDVQVVTAARLAASFTYVSPAARADKGSPYHVVDGGYYDNYGMTTLIEWLDEALEGVGRPSDGGPISRVLVIQIRSSPPSGEGRPTGESGALYQTAAPIETMLNVRATGQRSHNDEEFERLQRLWRERGVEIDNVIFHFCGGSPPLSWHLTGRDKERIEQWWRSELNGPRLDTVRQFLGDKPLTHGTEESPFDAPTQICAEGPMQMAATVR